MEIKRNTSYPLRLQPEIKKKAELEAQKNRRSLNAELGLLIEEGLRWRKQQRQLAT